MAIWKRRSMAVWTVIFILSSYGTGLCNADCEAVLNGGKCECQNFLGLVVSSPGVMKSDECGTYCADKSVDCSDLPSWLTPISADPLSTTLPVLPADVTPIWETLPTAETDCGKAEFIGRECECYEYLGTALIRTDTSDAGGLDECREHCDENCTPAYTPVTSYTGGYESDSGTSYTGGYESDSGGGGGCFIGTLFNK